jgi:hypothetical protein
LPLDGAAAKQAYSRRWARPAMPMTTRCVSRSSAHSKPNCSVANTSRPTNRRGGVSSPFWRAGTTFAGYTAASATVRRSNSKTCMRKIKAYRRAGCPPPGSVMVETGDPPPGRGQPAIQPYREVPHHIKLNCKSIRRTGSPIERPKSRDKTPPRKAAPCAHAERDFPSCET